MASFPRKQPVGGEPRDTAMTMRVTARHRAMFRDWCARNRVSMSAGFEILVQDRVRQDELRAAAEQREATRMAPFGIASPS